MRSLPASLLMVALSVRLCRLGDGRASLDEAPRSAVNVTAGDRAFAATSGLTEGRSSALKKGTNARVRDAFPTPWKQCASDGRAMCTHYRLLSVGTAGKQSLVKVGAGRPTVIIIKKSKPVNDAPSKPPTSNVLQNDSPHTSEPISSGTGSEKVFQNAAVASDSKVCSEIGTKIMRDKGGSASDAAIAVIVCLGAMIPQSTGIGGGFFLVGYDTKSKQAFTLDGRETAPQASHMHMFSQNPQAAITGGLAIAVPGSISAMYQLHARFGRVQWRELFMPTIRLLREGYKMEAALAKAIANPENRRELFLRPNLRVLYFSNLTGEPLREGSVLRDPVLARTLERISEEASSFWNGSLAADVVQDIEEEGGVLRLQDLANYQPLFKEAVQYRVRNYTMFTAQPPSSGVLLALILNVMAGYPDVDADANAVDVERRTRFYHRLLETFKHAFARRPALVDHLNADPSVLVNTLSSSRVARAVRTLIDDAHTFPLPQYDACAASPRARGGTSHVSVAASDGAVAVTSTINGPFGALVRGRRTGILFNNQMDDFSSPHANNQFLLPPNPLNFPEPHKRPASSMAPTIVLDNAGNPLLIIGAEDGPRIITSTAQVLLHTLFTNVSLKQAVSAQRMHHQLLPDKALYEPDFDRQVVALLRSKGHNLQRSDATMGVVQAILRRGDMWHAVSDMRKGGEPHGF